MAQGHPSGAHETVLACGVALDVVQEVQAENHPVHHAWEVHSNPDGDHATEVPGTVAAAVLPVPVGLPCASVLAWGDYGVVSFQVAYWDPFPYVVDHLVRSVLLALPDHPWDLPVDIPYPCPCSVHPVASVAR